MGLGVDVYVSVGVCGAARRCGVCACACACGVCVVHKDVCGYVFWPGVERLSDQMT